MVRRAYSIGLIGFEPSSWVPGIETVQHIKLKLQTLSPESIHGYPPRTLVPRPAEPCLGRELCFLYHLVPDAQDLVLP